MIGCISDLHKHGMKWSMLDAQHPEQVTTASNTFDEFCAAYPTVAEAADHVALKTFYRELKAHYP